MNGGTKSISSHEEEMELRRGPWTLEEDTLLTHYISCHGEGRWNLSAKCAGLRRTGKSCRLRWLNYLKPDVKRGNLTPHEQLLILELHSKWGNRWSKIAQYLPGRTDNEIKNYWRTRVQKQARQLNIESNSERFHNAVRCLWTPRLLQQMEQDEATTTSNENDSSSSQTIDSQNINFSPEFPSSSSTNYNINQISSDNSSSISQFPQNSEHQTSLYTCFDPNNLYNTSQNEEMYYETTNFTYDDMKPPADCQMAESNWVEDDNNDDDMACTTWNTDELWQFR